MRWERVFNCLLNKFSHNQMINKIILGPTSVWSSDICLHLIGRGLRFNSHYYKNNINLWWVWYLSSWWWFNLAVNILISCKFLWKSWLVIKISHNDPIICQKEIIRKRQSVMGLDPKNPTFPVFIFTKLLTFLLLHLWRFTKQIKYHPIDQHTLVLIFCVKREIIISATSKTFTTTARVTKNPNPKISTSVQ